MASVLQLWQGNIFWEGVPENNTLNISSHHSQHWAITPLTISFEPGLQGSTPLLSCPCAGTGLGPPFALKWSGALDMERPTPALQTGSDAQPQKHLQRGLCLLHARFVTKSSTTLASRGEGGKICGVCLSPSGNFFLKGTKQGAHRSEGIWGLSLSWSTAALTKLPHELLNTQGNTSGYFVPRERSQSSVHCPQCQGTQPDLQQINAPAFELSQQVLQSMMKCMAAAQALLSVTLAAGLLR